MMFQMLGILKYILISFLAFIFVLNVHVVNCHHQVVHKVTQAKEKLEFKKYAQCVGKLPLAFVYNFDKCWPIFTILSPLYNSPRNLEHDPYHYHIFHHTLTASLH